MAKVELRAGDVVVPPPINLSINEALAALSRMQLARLITQFDTNFERVRSYGATPEVLVCANVQDEVSLARVHKKVTKALEPTLKGVKVKVLGDLRARVP